MAESASTSRDVQVIVYINNTTLFKKIEPNICTKAQNNEI